MRAVPPMDKNGSPFNEWTENHAWFRTNYVRLGRKFDRQNVAVYHRRVVDHDRSLAKLLNRIRNNYPEDRVVIEYVTRNKRELVL
jgi:hypothetical protein